MQQESIILFRGETSTLTNNPVESSLVKVDKKLSTKQVVGDFSLIPTTAIEHLSIIASVQLGGVKIPSGTKSVKKGWRLIAKW